MRRRRRALGRSHLIAHLESLLKGRPLWPSQPSQRRHKP
jgi:hypothetical protein